MRLPVAGGLAERVLDLPAAASFEYRCPLRAGSCVLSLQQGREMLFYTFDPVRGKGRLRGKTDRWNQPFAWDVSPDGSRLAVMGSRRQIMTLADGVWHEIPIEERWGPEYIAWTADGAGFFVTSSSTLDLLHITIAGKVKALMRNERAQWVAEPIPSADGKYLGFQAQTYDFNAWMIDHP
jgi:hypothetical protein